VAAAGASAMARSSACSTIATRSTTRLLVDAAP
jgi:hypothetical protein